MAIFLSADFSVVLRVCQLCNQHSYGNNNSNLEFIVTLEFANVNYH